MNKIFKDDDSIEKVVGGLLSIIVIVVAIIEIFVNGVSTESVLSGIKDIAGTLITFILLVTFLKHLPVKPKSFRGKLEEKMKKIEDAYAPMICKHVPKDANASDIEINKKLIRYDIATNISALFGKECNDYIRFFELDSEKADRITFFVRKKFFGNTEKNPYNPEIIAKNIYSYMEKKYSNYTTTYDFDKDGASITVNFKKTLSTVDDIQILSDVVDDALMLFIAECKK